jgi:hypothetical protein
MNQHPTMTPAGFRQLLQMAKANIYNSLNHTYLLGTNCNGHHHVDGTYSSTLNGGNEVSTVVDDAKEPTMVDDAKEPTV